MPDAPGSTAGSNPVERSVPSGVVTLASEDTGGGRPLVLAHGLTATRRYVVHGSRLLPRRGYRLVSYDARGHGDSAPAPDAAAYRYDDLAGDLGAVLDAYGFEQAVLVGASMGAATVLGFALDHPERVSALVQVTPAYTAVPPDEEHLARWDALAAGLEDGGVDGFLEAYGDPPVAARFKGLVVEAIRQRLERHRHPWAVADALRAVPRSRPFAGLDELRRLSMPTLVVGSHDEADPQHPYEVARRYAELIRGAEFVSEEPGASPLAWRGAQLSRAIAAFLERYGLGA